MAGAVMSSIYNHYMTTYSPIKSDARLDNHKKGELKKIYSNIVKINKEAPLYLLDHSEETKNFAISLKENARQLQRTILSTAGNAERNFLQNQIAYSSDDNILTASYIGGTPSADENVPSYEIEVKSLASGQVNTGLYLPSNERSMEPGNYSFDVNTKGVGYEFQYSINEGDTNLDIQNKLARLFNHAGIGLQASVVEGTDNTSCLRISSLKTGVEENDKETLFTISDSSHAEESGSVKYLGIDYISTEASNADLRINGNAVSSSSNQLTIDSHYEINLKNVTPEDGEPVRIGIKANTESVRDHVRSLIGGYNSFLQAVDNFNTAKANNRKLSGEIKDIARSYTSELDTIGIRTTETGSLNIDENLLTQAAGSEDANDLLSPLMDFSSSLFNKGEQISRDPLNYAHQKIVAYKNPGKTFTSPYSISNYSGLFFNYYC